ncbi:hypothetical protein HMPREF9166_1652 [Selenomonas sp. oral taxon 149 str. 67H29BP]|nr:hypothetical protein HMPREF9166_1652 [Selenomonas sp. oral taxon 149 str. 67H29BP]
MRYGVCGNDGHGKTSSLVYYYMDSTRGAKALHFSFIRCVQHGMLGGVKEARRDKKPRCFGGGRDMVYKHLSRLNIGMRCAGKRSTCGGAEGAIKGPYHFDWNCRIGVIRPMCRHMYENSLLYRS